MLWHYTTIAQARGICKDGEIKVARLHVKLSVKPAAWFSSNPQWEKTATKMLDRFDGSEPRVPSLSELLAETDGLVRFAIHESTAPVDWKTFKKSSGIAVDTASELMLAGLQLGASPSEWFCSFRPVKREKWLAIEEITDAADLAAFRWKKSKRLN
jgi:hypothetical protein